MHTHNETDWKSMSYNDAARMLEEYERDYEGYAQENKDKAEDWWTEEKRAIKTKMADLRAKLNETKENAPDAWGEMKDAFGAAMAELSDGYNRSIRALKR